MAVRLLVVALAVVALSAGCGDTDADAAPELRVEAAWVPETAVDAAAVYLTLVNEGGADVLTGASTDATAEVELHEAVERDGLVFMEPRDGLEIGAEATLALDPLGRHLMLTGLTGPLAPGDVVTVELRFERSPPLSVEVEVVDYATHIDRLEAILDR